MKTEKKYPCTFSFRLDDETAKKLADTAHAAGYTESQWARKIIFEAVSIQFEHRGVRLRVQNGQSLRALLAELTKQGVNLNQITAKINTEGVRDRYEIDQSLNQIQANNAAITKAILSLLGASTNP